GRHAGGRPRRRALGLLRRRGERLHTGAAAPPRVADVRSGVQGPLRSTPRVRSHRRRGRRHAGAPALAARDGAGSAHRAEQLLRGGVRERSGDGAIRRHGLVERLLLSLLVALGSSGCVSCEHVEPARLADERGPSDWPGAFAPDLPVATPATEVIVREDGIEVDNRALVSTWPAEALARARG